ncbi:MAG: Fic family protein [Legionella sp.]|nr:Fic family protein [Legionella sp.]
MKIPMSPPDFQKIMADLIRNPDLLMKVMIESQTLVHAGYFHWDKIRHLTPPSDLTTEQWWLSIKLARSALYKGLPFEDKYRKSFVLATPDLVLKKLHSIDRALGNTVQSPELIINKAARDTYIIQSLVEEAITSSQLEGASTTRRVAKEMLRAKRKPMTISERMIFNNYEGMQFVREIKAEDLTVSIILELHRIITKNTLDEADSEGCLRVSNDVHVGDNTNQILHIPPDYKELEGRLEKICAFANAKEGDYKFFLHPVIKAIILHFMLAYDHPFEDGNGRTARALFYWSMANQGYWLAEFISISQIIKKSPTKYGLAYLHTETDANDTTYFVIQQLDVVLKAIDSLHEFITEESSKTRETEALIYTNQFLKGRLNYRQIAVITHALKHPGAQYLIESHRRSHGITYQTARTDLLNLVASGLLIKQKIGKSFTFVAPKNLEARIETGSQF